VFDTWKARARGLKHNLYALYLSYKDPRTPVPAKIVIGLVLAYALSPIDLIPDFIPVLGYLDDLIILPLGIWLALKLIPREVFRENREKAEAMSSQPSRNYVMAVIIVLIWLLIAYKIFGLLRRYV
jgi:uncharacterized membrane protein YkvA (DUF1232 family)